MAPQDELRTGTPDASRSINSTNTIASSEPPPSVGLNGSGAKRGSPTAASSAFGAVFDSSGEALLIVNPAGVIQRANIRARSLLFLPEAYAHRDLSEFLPGPAAEQLPYFLKGPDIRRRVETLLPIGLSARLTLRWIFPESGSLLLHLAEIPADIITEQYMQPEALQTEKMAALGRLVSGIAHELNNPLTAIMGYAQLLLGRDLSPQQLADALKVRREAERARRIVKNLLYFARQNKPERVRAQVNEIIERALASRSYELKVEDIVVECALAPDLPETMADPYQLQQVVFNLVVNAEQALLESRGRGRITVRTTHIAGNHFGRTVDRMRLEVSDDGPGVPREVLPRIFDPFFTTKPPGVGTGLGLSIVYGIVHQHGGEVSVENLPQGGAKFVVEIPVSPVTAAGGADSVATPSNLLPWAKTVPAIGITARRGRILVIEDEPTVAQLIVDVLRDEGHTIEATLDSQDGLTRLSRGTFDLIICDLRMPRLDGPAFFESLVRAGSPMRDHILFITGDTLAPRTMAFLEGNRLPYLIKPFLVEELKLAVHGLLDSCAGSSDTHAGVVRDERRNGEKAE